MKQDYNYKVSKEHAKASKRFFDEIKFGDIIYVCAEKKEINIDDYESNYINNYNRVSIVTDSMLEYDLQYLVESDNYIASNNNLLKNYRPYFVDFLIDIEKNIALEENRWYVAKFLNENIDTIIEDDDEIVMYDGILELSASPVRYENGTLLFFTNRSVPQEILNKINDFCRDTIFQNSTDDVIQRILSDIWKNEKINTIDCYNLGKGNADYIHGYSSSMLYDIGYSYREYPKRKGKYNYYRACNAIRHVHPSCVLLSHWDMDHILGCVYAKQRIFDVPWIAPSLMNEGTKKYSINAYRLARYLYFLNNLYLVDCLRGPLQIANVYTKDGVICLYLGGGNDAKISAANRQGLYIEIYSRNIHIVLSGDVPYKCMMHQLWDCNIDYLHVPHHCSDMDCCNLVSAPNYGKVAIISTNRCRKKFNIINYDIEHKKHLDKKFMKVICTIDNPSGNDNYNLSYRIDVVKNTSMFR